MQSLRVSDASEMTRRRLGAEFVRALSARDFDRLQACFDEEARGRLLTPSALAMPAGAAPLVRKFREWFGDADALELEHSAVSLLGERLAIGYRLRVFENGRWYRVAQHAYARVEAGCIEQLDLLCSGFQPEPAVRRGKVP